MKKFILSLIFINGIITAQADKGNITGFNGIPWGTTYAEVKDRFRTLASSPDTKDPVIIISDIPGREIKTSSKNVIYRYVFYKKPEILKMNGEAPSNPVSQPSDGLSNLEDQNRLFFVESSFSYVPAIDLEKSVSERYGNRTGGVVDKDTFRGYYLWSMQRGYVIQWVDPYKKKPFSRSLYYASKDIIEEIKADYKKFQYTREIKTLLDIVY